MTHWRCYVRYATEQKPDEQYAEVFLQTDSIRKAEELAQQSIASGLENQGDWLDIVVIAADRITPEQAEEVFKKWPKSKPPKSKDLEDDSVHLIRYIDPPKS